MRSSLRLVPTLTLGAALALSTACSDDTDTPADAGPGRDASTTTMDAGTMQADAGSTTLYDRLGKAAGIAAAVDAIVAAELQDPEIAGYFVEAGAREGALTAVQIKECLVAQLGSVSGGPETYPTTVSGGHTCRDMKTAHEGMGIDSAAFDKFVTIAAGVLTGAGVSAADVATIGGVLNSTKTDIVGEKSLYQRLGRAPGISAAVDAIVAAELQEPAIAAYFVAAAARPGALSAVQIKECLVAQLGNASGGPERYPTTVSGNHTCRDMRSSHAGLGISSADFDRFVMIAAGVLTGAGVSSADVATIGGVLNGTKADIVEER
jgi:hemoglobin